MQRLTQANLHKPADGIFGDCARTCMAMILGLDRDSIPNFGVHYDDNAAWCKAVDDFSGRLGYQRLPSLYKHHRGKMLRLLCSGLTQAFHSC